MLIFSLSGFVLGGWDERGCEGFDTCCEYALLRESGGETLMGYRVHQVLELLLFNWLVSLLYPQIVEE